MVEMGKLWIGEMVILHAGRGEKIGEEGRHVSCKMLA